MTRLPDTSATALELDDGWLRVWFDRPDRRNALSAELAGDLVTVLEAVRDDRAVRGICFRGRGGVFCAGGDLKAFAQISAVDRHARSMAESVSHSAARLFRLIDTAPQVTVALIEGAAMAGGFGIACACDVVVSTADARFALTETRIGLTPAQIAPYVLNRLGAATGRRLMLLASEFDGRTAGRIGLADELAEDADALAAMEAKIRAQLLACAPGAVAATKEVIGAAAHLDHAELAALAAKRFAECMISEEGREGIASFLERRKPAWAGPGD
jgi:isohexenylglutaconyl-CoA hydratase